MVAKYPKKFLPTPDFPTSLYFLNGGSRSVPGGQLQSFWDEIWTTKPKRLGKGRRHVNHVYFVNSWHILETQARMYR